MIKQVKYRAIDFTKYENCIENSFQKNFYAKKEILDHLSENWELLVCNDYQFVMPIPFVKKLNIKIVVLPLFCQQLGIFGPENNQNVEKQFLQFFMKNYYVLYYAFNFHNIFSPKLIQRKNYFIEKGDYTLLRKNYFKGRKSTVKTAQYLDFKEIQLSEVLDFIKVNFKGLDKKKDLDKFFDYVQFLDDNENLKIFGSFKENILTNLAILIDEEDQYSLLGLVNDENFRKDNGASFLIDRILKENIHLKSFDFMGGTIRGIEIFFKSFNSELQEYSTVVNSKKDLVKKLFIK